MNTNKYELLSYKDVLESLQKYKKSGTKEGGDFNYFDTPSQKFFKICFYFVNGDGTNNSVQVSNSSGLLAPTWLILDKSEWDHSFWDYNSAWSYLITNDEIERANKLKAFVNLLSNINVESPWYFNQIEGLEAVIERKQTMESSFKFEDERKKITIKCLPDPYDNRIGTLLDLYKEIVWSWKMKREILPSNLRKFDMGIYIFESPIANVIRPTSYSEVDAGFSDQSLETNYTSSYKYLEFHNCEIDYNSSKSGYGVLDNAEGISQSYSIDILFDDVYETRYNEFMMQTIGDNISSDNVTVKFDAMEKNIIGLSDYTPQKGANTIGSQETPVNNKLYDRIFYVDNSMDLGVDTSALKDGVLSKTINNAVGMAVDFVEEQVNKAKLGNFLKLGSLTLSKAKSIVNGIINGDVMSTAHSVASVVRGDYKPDEVNPDELGNLFDDTPTHRPSPEQVKNLGNLYKRNSAINNI